MRWHYLGHQPGEYLPITERACRTFYQPAAQAFGVTCAGLAGGLYGFPKTLRDLIWRTFLPAFRYWLAIQR